MHWNFGTHYFTTKQGILALAVGLCVVLTSNSTTTAQDTLPASAPAVHQSTPESTASDVRYICPMRCEGHVFHAPGSCPVCRMDLVVHPDDKKAEPNLESQLAAGGFFNPDKTLDAAQTAKTEPEVALMPGLPNTLFFVGSGLALLLALILFELVRWRPRWLSEVDTRRRSSRWQYPRLELTALPGVRSLLKWRGFPFILQAPVAALFIFTIVCGLIGNQDASRNLAPVLTWNIWWMGLIFIAFFAGEAWCTVCPWMGIPDWINKTGARLRNSWNNTPKRAGFGPWSVAHRNLGLNRPWPTWARSLWPAITMFLAVTWIELAYEAPYRPALTALMGLAMLFMAGTTLFIYERKGFCRHACLVGRVSGMYSMTGAVELRRRDTTICHACTTKDCLHGNDRGNPCPTREFMGAMNENTYCTLCTECIKSCPHDNIALALRLPAADVLGHHRKRRDEAWLTLFVFAVSAFHGLAMIPAWNTLVHGTRTWIRGNLNIDPGYLPTFSCWMFLFFAAWIALYTASCQLSKITSKTLTRDLRDFFLAFAYPLLPLAVAYHLAHNALHFFYEGSKAVRLASDPFGWGWDLFGTANMPLTLLLPLEWIWTLQLMLMIVGYLTAILCIHRAATRLFPDAKQARRARIPTVLLVSALTIGCLWLLAQPMLMRTPGT